MKSKQTAGRREIYGVSRKQETFLSLPMGKNTRSTGYPENQKVWGYGGFVVVDKLSTKETSFLRYSTFQDTSDLENTGFQLSHDQKVINILARVGSVET